VLELELELDLELVLVPVPVPVPVLVRMIFNELCPAPAPAASSFCFVLSVPTDPTPPFPIPINSAIPSSPNENAIYSIIKSYISSICFSTSHNTYTVPFPPSSPINIAKLQIENLKYCSCYPTADNKRSRNEKKLMVP
jgi:hypothetical protein